MSAAEAYPSEFANNGIFVAPRTPLTYEGRRWMPSIFDTSATTRVLKMSRQVGKSTFGSALSTIMMATRNRFNILYAAPEQDQTAKYSHDKVGPMISGSPALSNIIGTPNNVFEKQFSNTGSKYYLKWAKYNPDACRGITVDMIHYDEVQDQSLSDIEPVINEAMFTSDYKYLLYTGTPKSLSNPLHNLWENSTQGEWIVRCGGCSRYNNLGIKNIGLHGPICKHCGKGLDVDNGVWVNHQPGKKIAGFHVNQLHCKISHAKWDRDSRVWMPSQVNWDTLLKKFEDYSDHLFLNEVMGESTDTAESPITKEMLKAACSSDVKIMERMQSKYVGPPIYAGIDWGAGVAATVLALGQFRNGKFQIIHIKKYEGGQAKPEVCIPDILKVIRDFRAVRVHCDHGFGWGLNGRLDAAYGGHRVTSNFYSNSATAADHKWRTKNQEVKCLTVNKPRAIAAFIEKIKDCEVLFPRFEDFFPLCSEDFLSVKSEQDAYDNIRFVKTPGKNDDAFHACIYAYIIACQDASSSLI